AGAGGTAGTARRHRCVWGSSTFSNDAFECPVQEQPWGRNEAMSTMNGNTTYNRWSITLHWAMLGLFVLVYAFIELRVLFEKGSVPRETMKSLHFMFGLLIFGLVWARLFL